MVTVTSSVSPRSPRSPEGVARSPRFTPRPARRSGSRGSGGTARTSHLSQQGSNDNGRTANPRATASPGAALAAAYAAVSDFTGAIHGYYSHTSAPGWPVHRRACLPGGEASMSAGTCPVPGRLPFRRIIAVPFETCLAAVESGQRTGPDGELRIGESRLRGPIEHDRDSGTRRDPGPRPYAPAQSRSGKPGRKHYPHSPCRIGAHLEFGRRITTSFRTPRSVRLPERSDGLAVPGGPWLRVETGVCRAVGASVIQSYQRRNLGPEAAFISR